MGLGLDKEDIKMLSPRQTRIDAAVVVGVMVVVVGGVGDGLGFIKGGHQIVQSTVGLIHSLTR